MSAWAWAAVFLAIVGGLAWLAGRAARSILAGIADEAERGVLCTVDPKQPVPESSR
jgi:hypothetical protein